MPTTSSEGRLRERLKALADSVAGLTAARVKLGLVNFDYSTEFFQDLVTLGPMLVIKPAVIDGYDQTTKESKFTLECELWFGITADADYTFIAVEEILFGSSGLRVAWSESSNFTTILEPLEMTIGAPEVRTDFKPLVAKYTISLRCRGALC